MVPARFPRVLVVAFLTAVVLAARVKAQAPQPPADAAPPAAAQTPAPSTPPSPAAAAAEAFAFEKLHTRIRYEADGTGSREVRLEVRIKTEAGVQRWGQVPLTYTPATESLAVSVFEVRKADGTVVSATDSHIQDADLRPDAAAGIFLDLRQKILIPPSLRPGDLLVLATVATVHAAVAPGHFWLSYDFARDVTVDSEDLELDVPAATPARPVVTAEAPAEARGLQGEEIGDRRVYRWHWRHAASPPPDDAPVEDGSERVHQPDVRFSTFANWDDVGRWYAGLARPAAVADPAVRARALDLVKGLTTEEQRIRALFAFVSNEIRYVSISFGVGRYAPRTAAEVLANQYGDCKDKHTLLAAMLGVIGVHAFPALANVVSRPLVDVPHPGAFNHLVTVVPRGGAPTDWLWLDTTSGAAPYGFLTSIVRDAPVLLVRWGPAAPAMTGEVVTAPARPPFPMVNRFEITGRIDDLGVLHGHLRASFRGDDEVLLRATLRGVRSEELPTTGTALAAALGLSGTVTDVTISGLTSVIDPLVLEFDIRSGGVLDLEKSALTLPLQTVRLPATGEADWKGRTRVALGPPQEHAQVVRLALPEGMEARPPLGIEVSRGPLEYTSRYAVESGTLIGERTLRVLGSEVVADAAPGYLAFARAVRADESQSVAVTQPAGAIPVIPDGATPRELYAAGLAAYRNGRYEAAITFWRKVVDVEPRHGDALDALGLAYDRLGRRQDAVDAFKRQIDINPFHQQAHRNLAAVLVKLDQQDAAREAYLKHLEVNPLDGAAAGALGRLLTGMEAYEAAVVQLERALAVRKDDPWLHAWLARSHAGLKHYDAMRQSIDEAIAASPTPAIWTYCAWTLATAGQDLARARELAARTLASAAASLRGATAADATEEQIDLSERVAWSWATLGVVAMATKDDVAAEAHLRKAWALVVDPEIAGRLGELYERQERRADATGMYYAAVASRPSPPARIAARLERFVGKAAYLPQFLDGARRVILAEHGTVLPMEGQEPGRAELRVVISSAGRLLDVQFVRGDEPMRALLPRLRAAQYGVLFQNDAGIDRLVMDTRVACDAGEAKCFVALALPNSERARWVALEDTAAATIR